MFFLGGILQHSYNLHLTSLLNVVMTNMWCISNMINLFVKTICVEIRFVIGFIPYVVYICWWFGS